MSRYRNRFRFGLMLLIGLFVLINILSLALLALLPRGRQAFVPLLLTFVLISLSIGLPGVVLMLRRMIRPYEKLVDEAARAPVAKRATPERDETEFVLETFQTVVAQLQSQGKQLETLRAAASERADSAERFNERIIASVPSGLIAFDARGRATMVNQNARALLDAGDGEVNDQTSAELLCHAPDLAEMVARCLQSGELYRREESYLLSPPQKEARRLGATIAPIEFRDGRGALCLLTDITEVTELREALALKRNLESLGEMSAGLAHELKNSLATLHGYAQLLQSTHQTYEGRADAAAMLREVRNLSEMVTAFLNFARPQPLDLDLVSLAALVADCAEELRPLYEGNRVSLQITGNFPPVEADDRMLRQALLNVMRNAAEAIGDEAKSRQVTVRGSIVKERRATLTAAETEETRWARIEIQDTGVGIPPHDLQRVFIPFFTTKSSGHGVGLALVHRIITDHGGTIAAANNVAADRNEARDVVGGGSGGAVFTISLPLDEVERA